MIKNDKGITLTALIITVIILAILTSVTLKFNYNSIAKIKDNKIITQLGIVRQAVIERYDQAIATNQIKENSKNSYWIGEKIRDFSNVDLPEKSTIDSNEDINKFYGKITNYTCIYPEDYYYRLNPQTLANIGITDSKDTYIVNYSTGEVYNETKKATKARDLLYLPPVAYEIEENTGDKENFNDWTE